MPDEKPMNAGGPFRREAQAVDVMTGEGSAGPRTSSNAAGERLRNYDRLRLGLASLIQSALRLISEKDNPEAYRQCRDLLTSLAEDRFTLAVVGQFNRGKSSLMNAVLGMDRLPVGIVPLTSVITKVSYGNPERALIEFRGSSLKDEIPLDRLADFVTEAGNPGNQKQIEAAEVQLPSEFLRRGLFFVDTPGVGSSISANTFTTERFLPQADAVIFVTSFDSPLGQSELEFFRKVREHVRKVFLVVNKSDLVKPQEREHVLNFIRQRLEEEAGLREPRLFALSALAGLEAKLSASERRLSESGLPALEQSLVEFLTREKTGEVLLRICERASLLLEDVRLKTQTQTGTDEPPLPKTPTEHSAMVNAGAAKPNRAQSSALGEIIGQLIKLREELQGEDRNAAAPRLEIKPVPEAELMEAARKACLVCTRVADSMMKFMAQFQYQVFSSEAERTALARHGGLCPLHTWQYAEIASPQGISSSYPRVLMEVSSRLSRLARSETPVSLSARTNALTTGPDKCSACQAQAEAENSVLDEITGQLTPPGAKEPSSLPVLCLSHLSAVLKRLPNDGLARRLLEFEAVLFERLAENMQRYALKHDALRRHLNSADERIAYHHGLSQLVGDKRLQAPWHVEKLI